MLRAKGLIRTPDKVYAAGEILPPLPPDEEEWLVSIGFAERIPDEAAAQQEPEEPKRKKRR